MLPLLVYFVTYCLCLASIGSYAAAFTVRWPVKCHHNWQKEAHQLLNIPFKKTSERPKLGHRSCCPHCGQTLKWKDLIPIISFIRLKGHCRHCNQAISLRYPVIESLHIVSCLPLLWLSNDWLTLALYTCIMSSLITSAFIDIEHHLIPDQCITVLVSCGLLLGIISNTLLSSVVGMIVGFYLIIVVRWCYTVVRKQEGIGLGDAKLIAALGAWLGVSALPSLLLCASVGGILYTVVFRRTGSDLIAFGPLLIISAILVFYSSLWKNTLLLLSA
ncbi:prepilin peptidase [Marinomonas sp. A79]|uniref:Prepilin leader peptidase/N-methyltransferase n=1 Tax=Marinomonas vulgaris TaxID=2823372 RepID=A0ABS5HA99_9GAMM|nr:A24 family peptidase [Marinomonas vulgaris]MBR7888598.1 prepilin peptidase [Marinomonas vulgaris]